MEAIDDESSRVWGNLTMHGVTKEIKLDVLIQGTDIDPWGNTRAGLEVVGVLKRGDFDMQFNQALGSGNVLVGDKVKVGPGDLGGAAELARRSPMRVVIAGGGVAGLETLMAVRSLAGGLVELTLIAPDDEFVYRPVTVEEPFTVGRARRLPLQTAARQAGARFSAATVDAVDPEARTVTTSAGERLEYDALVLAVGAEVMPAVSNALTWDDRSDAEMVGGLLRDLEDGYSRSLAIVIPPGPGWPLRGYELALFITLQARSMGAELQTTIVRPEPPPLAALGSRATASIAKELERAGVAVVGTDDVTVERERTATVVLGPSGQRLEVDRVLALPVLRGRHVTGLPADGSGFVEVDEYCRVRGLRGIWAVGDATAFPLKSGGFAAEQADVAAEDIAAAAGAAVEPRAFDPTREDLVGLPAGRFLRESIGGSEHGDQALDLPVSAVPVLTYLQRDLAAGWRGYG